VIAANPDIPQINGMRLALAERYFEEGDYRSAFPHYLEVAQNGAATDAEATTALIRLAWMAYDGNGEIEAAIALFDQALAISPDSEAAQYLKGQVLWCGAGEYEAASDLFRAVLDNEGLDPSTRDEVEADLALVASGEGCA
jgi:tetratricopeptide (TPR) repeat protein